MRILGVCLVFAWFATDVFAHIGSPDVYMDAKAGPYQLFMTARPPAVIPGVAQIEVRAESPGVRVIRAAPLRMTGTGAKYAPIPDVLQRSKDDDQYYTGSLWLMSSGSVQIRFDVDGDQGKGVVSMPLPAVARRTKTMQAGLGVLLFGLMSFLVVGLVAISGAAVREAQLEPGAAPAPARIRRSRVVMGTVFLLLIAVVWMGNRWWNSEASAYENYIYKPLQMSAGLVRERTLELRLSDPGWLTMRKLDDFIPDHGHLMHLYMIRKPAMDTVFHLHPELEDSGLFRLDLPDVPAGRYQLYADIVHEDGFPETMVAAIDLPRVTGGPLSGDDAKGQAPALDQVRGTTTQLILPDGYRMVWVNGNGLLKANRPELFRFQLLDPKGSTPGDMAFYMGMLGHAAFVKADGTVFAHIHPNGSVAMAALMMAEQQNVAANPPHHAGMPSINPDTAMRKGLPNEAGFPYGFPTPGRYRIIVQMKHGGTVESGIFDANVT
jgi:hypothetical protein